jgi:NADPH:quinone reductase-like Zn-dependent oxidoreductase
LREGETLLVHGGSSGIGLAAIQLAKAFGASVITTVGSAEKAAYCRSVGAEHALNYREQDFAAEVAIITGKRGTDVILDMVGGDYIEKNLKCLAVEGRLVFIAFLHGSRAEIDWRFIMLKRQTITGSTMRASPHARKAAIAKALRERVWPLFEAGKLKPAIYRVFPLAEAAAAHALMESSQHIGKIMLTVRPE